MEKHTDEVHPLVIKCLCCSNKSNEGRFEGPYCYPCARMSFFKRWWRKWINYCQCESMWLTQPLYENYAGDYATMERHYTVEKRKCMRCGRWHERTL